jgi:alpha-ribazole phosphatase/probable phosphoglycerate mutase
MTNTSDLEVTQMNLSQELLVIRHATTHMNGTLCGQSDPPLNAMGRAQATALAALLRTWNVRRLYTSDLRRAVQTAHPLAKLWAIPVDTRSDLREMSFGDWEGRSWSQIRANQPEIANMESSLNLCAPGGETFACFRVRVLRALKEIVLECNGSLTAIVTHLGVIRVLLKELSSGDCMWEPWHRIDHCSVYHVCVDATFLEPYND